MRRDKFKYLVEQIHPNGLDKQANKGRARTSMQINTTREHILHAKIRHLAQSSSRKRPLGLKIIIMYKRKEKMKKQKEQFVRQIFGSVKEKMVHGERGKVCLFSIHVDREDSRHDL